LFRLVNVYLEENGLKVSRGTIVDATIINAPSSTKNKNKERDPEMHQTKKGNQWYFGMKAHIGVDSQTKLIHSVAATPANTHDSQL
ncbi:MAG: transposase, partial [Gammaproteobacteria bacterium]